MIRFVAGALALWLSVATTGGADPMGDVLLKDYSRQSLTGFLGDPAAEVELGKGYYMLFWFRRKAEGNADLARSGLETIHASMVVNRSRP